METVLKTRQKTPAQPARRRTFSTTLRASFPVVGIGASAGGLEALELFLGRVPANSGMAFVIVQHLDPTHKGIMPELLQRVTGMNVVQVRDRTTVRVPVEFPSSFSAGPPMDAEARPAPQLAASLQSVADQLILQQSAPPAALVNDQ